MRSHSRITIPAGATGRTVLMYAADAADPSRPRTGLRAGTAGAAAAFVREGEPRAHDLPLTDARPGQLTAGGWAEVDPEAAPGVYELGLPDTATAPGSTQAFVIVRFPGAAIEPAELSLVRYDPQEGERIGMDCLIMEVRREFLRQGLPRLAEMELSLRGTEPLPPDAT